MVGFPNVRGLRLHEGIVTFEFSPTLGILAKDMDKFGMDIRSFREPLERAVSEVMIPSIRKNFDAQGRPAWEPLSDDTLELRDRVGAGSAILNRTGLLKRNMGFKSMWTFTTEYAIIKDLPDRIWYGKVHQAGAGGMRTRINRQTSAAKRAGRNLSQDQAAKLAMQALDKELLSGGAKKQSNFNIPARPFVMFQDEDYDNIEDVFQKWLGERAAGSGWHSV